jgi:hypothetical protein
MERHLGRRLEPWELVHHRDNNPQNNAIENLEIAEWGLHTAHHHSGCRRDAEARRSMEAFALMREELRRERKLNEELLEALKATLFAGIVEPTSPIGMVIAAAIAKATGEAEGR